MPLTYLCVVDALNVEPNCLGALEGVDEDLIWSHITLLIDSLGVWFHFAAHFTTILPLACFSQETRLLSLILVILDYNQRVWC